MQEYLDKEEEDGLKRYIESLKDSSFETHRHFNELYNRFMARFGRRGPGEVDIANARYEMKKEQRMSIDMLINLLFSSRP